MSIVLSAPAASLSTAASGSGGGGGGGGWCFISSAQKSFNRDIMRGLALLGLIIILGLLIQGRKALGRHRAIRG